MSPGLVDRICQGTDHSALARKHQAVEQGWLEALLAAMKTLADEDVQRLGAESFGAKEAVNSKGTKRLLDGKC